MILQLFVPMLGAALIVLLITPVCIKLAIRFHLIDQPNSAPHKIHKYPISKAGGMSIAVTVTLFVALSGHLVTKDVRAMMLAAIFILLFGLLDDFRGLSASWKLSGQLLGAVVLIWQGVQIQIFQKPVLDIGLTIFWIVGITNAFNLVDSMDGLVVGLGTVATIFFLFVTIGANQINLAYVSAIILGCCIGMYYYNTSPAKTFLGDSGAQLLGFLLAALAIAYNPPGLPQPSSWFVPILLLWVPIFDTTFVVISRLRRGLPIYKAGQDHVYHRLTQLGMPSGRAVATMHIAAFLSGCLAFVALPLPPLQANLLFALALLVSLFAIIRLQREA